MLQSFSFDISHCSDQNLPFDATKAFVKKTVIVTIPPPYDVFTIGYLSLWCITFTQDFGHVVIPDLTNANIPPYVEEQVCTICYFLQQEYV